MEAKTSKGVGGREEICTIISMPEIYAIIRAPIKFCFPFFLSTELLGTYAGRMLLLNSTQETIFLLQTLSSNLFNSNLTCKRTETLLTHQAVLPQGHSIFLQLQTH